MKRDIRIVTGWAVHVVSWPIFGVGVVLMYLACALIAVGDRLIQGAPAERVQGFLDATRSKLEDEVFADTPRGCEP